MVVRDPYWLHTYWELSRAHAGPRAGGAGPGVARRSPDPPPHGRDQRGHDGRLRAARPRHRDPRRREQLVHRRPAPPRSFRVDIGYLVAAGQVLRPGPVERRDDAQGGRPPTSSTRTGRASRSSSSGSSSQSGGANGSAGSHDLRDLFEERLRRPMQSLSLQSLGTGALAALGRDFHFEIDAELIVYGIDRAERQGDPAGRAGASSGPTARSPSASACPTRGRSSRPSPPAPTASRSGRSSWPSSGTPRNSSR